VRDRDSCLVTAHQLKATSSRVSNQVSPCSSGLWVCEHVIGCVGEVGCVGDVGCVGEFAGDGVRWPESERHGGVLRGGIDGGGDIKCPRRRTRSRQRDRCSARSVVSSIIRCGVCSARLLVMTARLDVLPTAWGHCSAPL
jgi:hypothetical protein